MPTVLQVAEGHIPGAASGRSRISGPEQVMKVAAPRGGLPGMDVREQEGDPTALLDAVAARVLAEPHP
jgi:hypothetical protein